MADARLDLEVALDGDQQAAAGLDKVAGSAESVSTSTEGLNNNLGPLADMFKKARAESDALQGGLKTAGQSTENMASSTADLTKATFAAHSASRAYSQLMSGNFVGAARSAAMAVRGLWAVMLANPFTAVLAGIAAAVANLKLLMDWHDRAKERAKEHRLEISRLGDELNAVLYGTPSENASRNVGGLGRGQLEAGIEARQKANERLAAEARKLKSAIDDIKVGGFGSEKEQKAKDELIVQYRDLLDQMRDNLAVVGIYEKAIEDLDNAEAKRAQAAADRNAQELADKKKLVAEQEKLMEKELEHLRNMQMAEGALKTKAETYSRERKLAGAPDKIAELEMKKRFLAEDWGKLISNTSTEAESKRLDIRQEMWRIDQQITEERKKQAEAEAKGADSAKTAAAEKLAVTSDPRIKPENDLLQRSMARMKAMRAGNLENWKEYLPGGFFGQDESPLRIAAGKAGPIAAPAAQDPVANALKSALSATENLLGGINQKLS